MRPFGLGLATSIFLAAMSCAVIATAANAAPDISAEGRAKGMKEAPALAAAAHLPCTVSDAVFLGAGTGPDKVAVKYYEVACKEGLGFVIVAKDKDPAPTAFDCVIAATPGPDGKPGNSTCRLPANLTPSTALQPMVTQAGKTCTVSKGRYVASSPTENFYEVGCAAGDNYIVEDSRNYSGAPKTSECMDYDATSGVKCTFTTRAQQFAAVDKLAATSGKPCAIKDRRHIGNASDGAAFYEVACSRRPGFVIKADSSGKFLTAINCVDAGEIAGGCTLTDMGKLVADTNARYASLSKAAGFDCTVSKHAAFPTNDNSKDIVELACSGIGPTGRSASSPTGAGRSRGLLNCLRSEAEGYQAVQPVAPASALYDGITAQLRAKGRTSCVVSNARPFAVATSKDGVGMDDFIEVGCADGGPGLVLVYPDGSSAPDELLNCAQVKSRNGGCQIPAKKSS